MVGKISGVYKQTTPNAPEIPNFPIMLKVSLKGTSDVSPVTQYISTDAGHNNITPSVVSMQILIIIITLYYGAQIND